MADLTVTAASVAKGTDAVVEHGIAGATITAGQLVYKDTSDSNKLKLVDVDSATVLARSASGVALNGGASGQTIAYQTAGQINLGATLATGIVYVGSDTAGGIRPSADNGVGDYTVVVGVAISTSLLKMGLLNSGVAQ